jgi:hypothetical protein
VPWGSHAHQSTCTGTCSPAFTSSSPIGCASTPTRFRSFPPYHNHGVRNCEGSPHLVEMMQPSKTRTQPSPVVHRRRLVKDLTRSIHRMPAQLHADCPPALQSRRRRRPLHGGPGEPIAGPARACLASWATPAPGTPAMGIRPHPIGSRPTTAPASGAAAGAPRPPSSRPPCGPSGATRLASRPQTNAPPPSPARGVTRRDVCSRRPERDATSPRTCVPPARPGSSRSGPP